MVITVSVIIALVDPLKTFLLLTSDTFQLRFRPVAPNRQPPLALCPRHGQLCRRGERPDRLDITWQRARLPSLALGRDFPSGRDHRAGPGQDGRHAADWGWDHAMVRARWFRGPRRQSFAVYMHVRVSRSRRAVDLRTIR